MISVGSRDPAAVMVDQMLDREESAFRDQWRERLSGPPVAESSELLRIAIGSTTLPDGTIDLVRLALLAEESAGQPCLRALASVRYRLLAAKVGSRRQRALVLNDDAPVQALCIADRGVHVARSEKATIVNGLVAGVLLASEAALLYLVVFEGHTRECYLVEPATPGVTIEAYDADGCGNVTFADAELAEASRLPGDPLELERQLALIATLDGLEALAAAQRALREAVAAAKAKPVGTGTGFDDQDTQFRLAAVQARLIIASGYRTSLYRKLKASAVAPAEGAIAKLWLSACAEEAARVAQLADVGPGGARVSGAMRMLADAMRGNVLRETIAATLGGQ